MPKAAGRGWGVTIRKPESQMLAAAIAQDSSPPEAGPSHPSTSGVKISYKRNLKMLAVGTAMANRKHYPKQQKKKQMCERGALKYLCCSDITALVWNDQRPINFHDPCEQRKPSFTNYIDSLYAALVGKYRSANVHKARHIDCDRLQNVGLHHPVFSADVTNGHICIVYNQKHQRYKKANPGVAYQDIPVPRSKSCLQCSHCKAFLCVKRGSACWMDYTIPK
ncbi:hypothetical protein RRG08_056734 [Elysia crispata]|uniref:PiggyBac transposable element-derived protein domain-containing protein n=1 Tax=Elysia crispata TaxID=231223 RepID=A0AAE0YWY6_9GAST|nr:hypothetical protein RRG08_056734 [Elysia crispata]